MVSPKLIQNELDYIRSSQNKTKKLKTGFFSVSISIRIIISFSHCFSQSENDNKRSRFIKFEE